MITGVVRDTVDPARIEAFERFASAGIGLVNRYGGTHHGYFLPGEGSSDEALAPVSFPGLAEYEVDRERFDVDPDFVARDESGCVLRHERTVMRPHLG